MEDVRGFKALWLVGFKALLVVAGGIVGFGILCSIVAGVAAELLGADASVGLEWLLYAAPLWVPVGVGNAARALPLWRQAGINEIRGGQEALRRPGRAGDR
jgi:hypothetical protein